jgi:chorismate-pyruvate lyase
LSERIKVLEVEGKQEVDESAPGTNTPSNEDVRLGVQPLGEIQFEDQQETIKEGVSNPITME